jgi:hypothetical protein
MNRVCSILRQLLQLFSRVEFEAAVRQHQAERFVSCNLNLATLESEW